MVFQLWLLMYYNCVMIKVDGEDFFFVSVVVVDDKGDVVFIVEFNIIFFIIGFGDIVIMDNGDLIDMVVFLLKERKVF